MESELFGHERGSFTGATIARAGWFEAARGGTLFLDEIGDLPFSMQVKLLRVLQERQVVRLGSRSPVAIDVRVVAATNVNLEDAVAAGRFREDLYYRLQVATLHIAPLRERPADILPLAQYFLGVYGERLGLKDPTLSSEAIDILVSGHSWPGNTRELENVIHHALLVCRENVVRPEDLRLSPLGLRTPTTGATQPLKALQDALLQLFEDARPSLYEEIETAITRTAYEFCERNQVQTARLLRDQPQYRSCPADGMPVSCPTAESRRSRSALPDTQNLTRSSSLTLSLVILQRNLGGNSRCKAVHHGPICARAQILGPYDRAAGASKPAGYF